MVDRGPGEYGKAFGGLADIGYTTEYMQQFLNNRYVRLTALTVGIGVLFYIIIWLIVWIIGLKDFSPFLIFLLSALGAGLVVYKFLSRRVY
jgi:hypothetical protein